MKLIHDKHDRYTSFICLLCTDQRIWTLIRRQTSFSLFNPLSSLKFILKILRSFCIYCSKTWIKSGFEICRIHAMQLWKNTSVLRTNNFSITLIVIQLLSTFLPYESVLSSTFTVDWSIIFCIHIYSQINIYFCSIIQYQYIYYKIRKMDIERKFFHQNNCHFPKIQSLIASTYWAGTQYIQYLEASVGPNCNATIWYSLCPSIGSLTTLFIEFNGSFSVLSFVP